jgi:hypothetical protein
VEKRLCSKLGIALIVVASVFVLTAAAALAATNAQLEPSRMAAPSDGLNGAALSGTGPVSATQPISRANIVATAVASFCSVPVQDVVALHSDGFGYGVIAMAHFLALDGEMSIQDVLALKESGMGMGEIAKYLDLSPGNRGRNLGMIVSGRSTLSDTVPTATQRLSERVGVTPEEIAGLLDQGATYGTIVVAYKTATQFEGVTPQELVTRRLAGDNWGQIKRDLRSSESQTRAVASPARGNQGDQGRGNPQNEGNRGRGQERGQGHHKNGNHGGGKKH